MGTQLPCQKGDRGPRFSAHVRCGQMAGRIKISLGIQAGLGSGDFVLDVDPGCSRVVRCLWVLLEEILLLKAKFHYAIRDSKLVADCSELKFGLSSSLL